MLTVMKPNNVIINSECMRDLCGTFNGSTDWNRALLEVLPEATLTAFRTEPKWFGLQSDEDVVNTYKEVLTKGFEAFLEDERTSDFVHAWMHGEKSEFSDDEVANLCDVYYVDYLSVVVEQCAVKMLHARGLKHYCDQMA